MSHFSVLIVGHNDLDGALAPFQEQVDADSPYAVFTDETSKLIKEHGEDSVTKVVMPDGRLLNTWDNEFRKPGAFGIGGSTHEVPEHLPKREVPFKELYATWQDYAQGWCGHKGPSNGDRYGYFSNPNAKWDWWQIGGRYSGRLKIKPNIRKLPEEALVGKPGVFQNTPEPGWYDRLRKRDVDIEGMRDQEAETAGEQYDWLAEIVPTTLLVQCEPWDSVRDRICGEGKEFKYDLKPKACEAYDQQPAVRMFREFLEKNRNELSETMKKGEQPFGSRQLPESVVPATVRRARFLFWLDDSMKSFFCTREQHVALARLDALTTFAYLKDGKWEERGKMGWWACVSDEKETATWAEHFNAMFDSLPDDTLLTVVDCHI